MVEQPVKQLDHPKVALAVVAAVAVEELFIFTIKALMQVQVS